VFSAEEIFPEGNPAMLLRGYRGKLGMTQKELAEKLGVTQNRVSDMKNGKRQISKDKERIKRTYEQATSPSLSESLLRFGSAASRTTAHREGRAGEVPPETG